MSKIQFICKPGFTPAIDSGPHEFETLSSSELRVEHDSIIIVPAILDNNNAMSYDGVSLAIRAYLDFIQKGEDLFAIYILSSESKGSFYSHCDYADFLKCPNVHFLNNAKQEIESTLKSASLQPLRFSEATEALNVVRIKAPSAYKTHHSITNEWSIYRWSKYLELEDIKISKEIEESLYFKYLSVIHDLQVVGSTSVKPIFPQARVLLVDDEAEKGWKDFFFALFSKSPVTFEAIGQSDFAEKATEEIENIVLSKVKEFNPDVIILDMRLEETDFEPKDAEKFTGVRILKRIKDEVNKGIQVIGFTASNKVWNYLEWSNSGHGIDDIVIKESPEKSRDSSYTQTAISHLAESILTGIERAVFLKKADDDLRKIRALIQETDIDDDFITESIHNTEVSYELMREYNIDGKYLGYAYMQLFQILEKYMNLITYWDGDYFVLKFGDRIYKILHREGNSNKCDCAMRNEGKGNFSFGKGEYDISHNHVESNLTISAAQIFLLGQKKVSQDWIDVRFVRNKKVAHPVENGAVTKEDFKKLLSFLKKFFNKGSLHPRNGNDALAELPKASPATNSLGDNPALASLIAKLNG